MDRKNDHFTPHQLTPYNVFYSPVERREIFDVDRSLSNVFSTLNIGQLAAQTGYSGKNDHITPYHPFGNIESRSSYNGFNNEEILLKRLNDLKQMYPCYNDSNFGLSLTKSQSQSQSYGQNERMSMMRKWSLKSLRGKIYDLAKDQNGCRLLQSLFERPSYEDVEIVLFEVVEFMCELMRDQYGNYLVQKLVAVCDNEQKLKMVLSLVRVPNSVVSVCMNPYGTRAMQKLLENLRDPDQVMLVMRALQRGAAALATDPNGHHVIQYCLVNFHSEINKPILIDIAEDCYKIATDRCGCCVLQACVEHSRGEVKNRILTEIMANSVHLAEDPFGNYVLQHMIGLKRPELTALLVRQLQGNFAVLSCNKYASNVVEKCLNEAGEEARKRIVLELIRSPNAALLLTHPYANFVFQSALKVSKGPANDCLRSLISQNMSFMRSNLYGKRILEKFEKKRVNFS